MPRPPRRPLLQGRLILASASPRRRDLLDEVGLEFEIEPSEVSEELEELLEPEVAAVELARRKARSVADGHRGERSFVIGADTVVALGEGAALRLLGKPAGADEAREMLEGLSGSRHRVVTGVAVVDNESGALLESWERTWVSMRPIRADEVDAYVASGEWRGKAGGYAIQENADAFVTSLEEGGFDNVVGLPVERTLRLLHRAGAISEG